MRKRVKLLLGGLALIMSTTMVGCSGGKTNPEAVVEKAISELKDVESLTTEMEMVMDFSAVMKKTKLNMTIEMLLSMDQMVDEQIAYAKGAMNFEYLGESAKTEMETYTFKEKGNYKQYVGVDDDWEEVEIENKKEDPMNVTRIWNIFKESNTLEHKGTDTVNDEKTIVIEGKIDGEVFGLIMSMFSMADNQFGIIDDLDLEDEEIVMEAQFFQDSGLPASISVDLTSVFEKSFKGEDYEIEGGVTIEVDEVSMSYVYTNYNDVDDIEVPDDLDDWVYGYDDYEGNYIDGVEDPEGPWKSYEFTLDKKTYKLPVAYSEFTANGWEIDSSSNSRLKLDGESKEIYIGLVNEDGDTIYATFYNDSKEEKDITDCIIISIEVDSYYAEDLDFSLPGGVEIGMSEDKLNDVYEEYSEIYESTYASIYYYYGDNEYDDEVSIHIMDGEIYSISISHK